MQPPKSDNNPNPFSNLQNTASSFANQVNNFASNIQDYVTSTVSGVFNPTFDGSSEQSTTTNSSNASSGASFNFVSANNRPFDRTHATAGSAARATSSTTGTTTNAQRAHPPPPTAASATARTTSTKNQQPRRKSLSEIKAEENIEDLNIRELKEILAANFVDFKGCVEKNELLDKVRRLYRDRLNEKRKAKELDDSPAGDNELCKICMDAIADCVFLDCGHMVTCVKCGKLLAECPICRSNIVRVVRVFKS
ncbi:hypothetical protein I4U23_002469 [Adineta vaga]|nr:hypothetical protein I4U23_002469 [Adineta vaga]